MEITNRVAESEIEVYNLEELWDGYDVAELDLAPFLHEGLILREKEFRQHLTEHDWSQYENQHVAVYCSTDAIIPTWAFMLMAVKLEGVARSVTQGRTADLLRDHYARALEREDWSQYEDCIIVVKGCGGKMVPTSAYLTATQKLKGVARKLMFGEPCSSVPLWRKPKPKKEKPKAAKPASVKRPDLPTSSK